MTPLRLPSLDVPETQKRAFSEADVHSTLFEPDMSALGFPPRTSNQADGEYFVEQRSLALRRLRSGRSTGFYDGLYLSGNSPVVLCELKRYDALDSPTDFDRAKRQLQGYASSEDFAVPPPFLVLYCPDAEVSGLRTEIDDAIFDLFEIRSSREEIRHFYATVGRVEVEPQTASE